MEPVGKGGADDASVDTDGVAPAVGLAQLQVAAEEAATAARGAERKLEKQRQQLADAEAVLPGLLEAEVAAKAAVEAEFARWKAENGAGDQ